jgi:hypothetical protein
MAASDKEKLFIIFGMVAAAGVSLLILYYWLSQQTSTTPPTTCSNNSQCPNCAYCNNGTCTDSNCGSNGVCCQKVDDCSSGNTCKNGCCVPETTKITPELSASTDTITCNGTVTFTVIGCNSGDNLILQGNSGSGYTVFGSFNANSSGIGTYKFSFNSIQASQQYKFMVLDNSADVTTNVVTITANQCTGNSCSGGCDNVTTFCASGCSCKFTSPHARSGTCVSG